MKKWTFRKHDYEMTWVSCDGYQINGCFTSDESIYKNVDNEEYPKKMRAAKLAAEQLVLHNVHVNRWNRIITIVGVFFIFAMLGMLLILDLLGSFGWLR